MKTILSYALGIVAFGLLLMLSCTDPGPDFPEGDVVGYKPIYASEVDQTITLESSRSPTNTGKIFLQGDLLLLNEVNQGIHFINNEDPTNPINLGFLRVVGSKDMSVKDDLLYVNQFNDIVTIDFSDLNNVREIARETNAFQLSGGDNQLIPPQFGYYFECVDTDRGQVVDWQLTTITDPKCYR